MADDLGIASLPPERQEQLIAQFSAVAIKAATISIMERLSEGKRDEFMRLARSGDARALQTFLDAELPDHEALAKAAIDGEIRRFKESQPL